MLNFVPKLSTRVLRFFSGLMSSNTLVRYSSLMLSNVIVQYSIQGQYFLCIGNICRFIGDYLIQRLNLGDS